MKLLGISGTVTGSKTLSAVHKAIERVRQHDSRIETSVLDLKQYDMQFCDGRSLERYNSDTQSIIHQVVQADAYIIGTPIFQASLTGALKNVFDLAPVSAFRHKVVGFIATGGTHQHHLVIENQLKPIAGYFRSYIAPGYVYIRHEDFNGANEMISEDVLERIDKLAEEVVFMQAALKR